MRVFEENDGKSPMYYCTLCNRPYGALHEAIEHEKFCGQAVPIQPAFRSVTTAATFNEDDDTQTYQRPWVGLTEEEIEIIGGKVANEKLIGVASNFRVRFARAIEAALKKKNT